MSDGPKAAPGVVSVALFRGINVGGRNRLPMKELVSELEALGLSDVLPIVHTAPWGYLRLRRPTYDDGDLGRWAQNVAAQGRERAFIFFKHEDDGAGPEMAARFAKIANG